VEDALEEGLSSVSDGVGGSCDSSSWLSMGEEQGAEGESDVVQVSSKGRNVKLGFGRRGAGAAALRWVRYVRGWS